jgi:CBS domain-containing protein
MKTKTRIVAADLMSPRVTALSPDDSIATALRTFSEARIGGAPVVDAEGRIVGVLTVSDVVRDQSERLDVVEIETEIGSLDMVEPFDDQLDEDLDPAEVFFLKEDYSTSGGVRVEDRMTREVVCVAPDATLPQLCEAMATQRIHRVMVTREGELLGVVSSFDVVRAVAGRVPRKTVAPRLQRARAHRAPKRVAAKRR